MIKTCIALLTNPHVTYDHAELREFMDIVRRGGDRVDRLVRDFLAILKLESGVARREAREALETEDVAGAIDAVIYSLQHDIEERNVTVQVQVAEDLPALPVFDEHLQMVIEKLLHNAIKFSKPEGGPVLIRVTTGNNTFRFEVVDRGVGIPKEDQARIFDGFYQLAQAGSERQGAGLGLAVARGLVELYGGKIGVRSQVDVGSTFGFILPMERKVAAAAPSPEPGPLAPPEPTAPPPTGEGGDVPLTAEEAFRRLGITFEEEEKDEEPPKEEGGRRGIFRRKK